MINARPLESMNSQSERSISDGDVVGLAGGAQLAPPGSGAVSRSSSPTTEILWIGPSSSSVFASKGLGIRLPDPTAKAVGGTDPAQSVQTWVTARTFTGGGSQLGYGSSLWSGVVPALIALGGLALIDAHSGWIITGFFAIIPFTVALSGNVRATASWPPWRC